MLLKTPAIILRNVKYGETSLILDAYTRGKGRQSYIINGVRSAKAKVSQSLVGVTSLVDMVVYHRENKDLNRIKEVRPAHIYQALPFDVVRGTVGLFMAELISRTIKESEENPDLFEFLYHSFVALDEAGKVSHFPVVFPILLMPYIGFSLGNDWTEKSPYFDIREGLFVADQPHLHYLMPEPAKWLSYLRYADLHSLESLRIPHDTRKMLLDGVLEYYRYHVENFTTLNSHMVLRDVLGGN
jgi:DNA repair protein RecO (recombination protein O)